MIDKLLLIPSQFATEDFSHSRIHLFSSKDNQFSVYNPDLNCMNQMFSYIILSKAAFSQNGFLKLSRQSGTHPP